MSLGKIDESEIAVTPEDIEAQREEKIGIIKKIATDIEYNVSGKAYLDGIGGGGNTYDKDQRKLSNDIRLLKEELGFSDEEKTDDEIKAIAMSVYSDERTFYKDLYTERKKTLPEDQIFSHTGDETKELKLKVSNRIVEILKNEGVTL